jgi:hypothetical protein
VAFSAGGFIDQAIELELHHIKLGLDHATRDVHSHRRYLWSPSLRMRQHDITPSGDGLAGVFFGQPAKCKLTHLFRCKSGDTPNCRNLVKGGHCSVARRSATLMGHSHRLSKKLHSLPSSIRRIIQPRGWRVLASRLVATAAENRCGVESQMPKASAGRFTQQALRFGFLAI